MIRKVLINAAALALAALLVPGISVDGATLADKALTLIVVALIFGVVNALIRPIAKGLSLPLVILTLGLFLWVLNALMLMLTSWLAGQAHLPFHVDGFIPAVLGAFVVALVAAVLGRDRKRADR